MKILLLAGGWSSEREVSLKGAREVKEALKRLGHTVCELDPLDNLPRLLATGHNWDFAFINMHGAPGEDGLIQSILQKLQVPYNGSGPSASIIALNKYLTKMYFRDAGLPVAPDALLTANNWKTVTPPFSFPMIMKPNAGGSSIRLQIIHNQKELTSACEQWIRTDQDEYILEPFVEGIEATCPVLGNIPTLVALPPILIKPFGGQIFDYQAKYSPEGAQELCPAPLDEAIQEKLRNLAIQAHSLLGLSGYSRTDFILRPDGQIIVLETNTLPGMTTNSLLPKSAAVYGLSFDDLIARIIRLGLERKNDR